MPRLVAILIVAASLSTARYSVAQSGPGGGFRGVSSGRGTASGFTISFGSHPKSENFSSRQAFLAAPFFYPPYWYEPRLDLPAPPEMVIAEPAPPPAAHEEPKPTSGVIIEWQGDRFVRMNASEYNLNPRSLPPDSTEALKAARSPAPQKTKAQARRLPPAVLVFSDGREEQTSNYAIVGGVLYEYADYWIGSASTKKISMAELDLPATVRANQERGVRFVLPSGPNEVVTRP